MKQEKNRKLTFTIVITLLLLVIAFILIFNNRDSTLDKEQTNFSIKDTSTVTKIYLTDKRDREILLVKQDNGKWRLNDKYWARQDFVELFLETVNKVRIKQPVAKAARNNMIKVISSAGKKVEIYQDSYRINLFDKIKLFPYEKKTKTFYVGHNTQNNLGTYMILEDSETPYITYIPGFRGALRIRFTTDLYNWKTVSVFNDKIKNIESINVKVPENEKQSFKIVNNHDKTFSLLNYQGQEVDYSDTTKLLRYLNYYQNISLEAYIKNEELIDSLKNASPLYKIQLVNNDQETKTISIYHKPFRPVPKLKATYEGIDEPEEEYPKWDATRFYALVNEGEDMGIVQSYQVVKIMRALGYFTNEKTNAEGEENMDTKE